MQADTVEIIEESLVIESASQPLPAVLAYPFASHPRGSVLVAGPHPLMGGGLQNNVVRALARGMAEHGFTTLRFAYGGAGPSTETMREFWQSGHAPDDPERIDDAYAALAQLKSIGPEPVILIGYSFGAAVLGALLSVGKPSHIVLIGATLRQHCFDFIQRSVIHKLVIAANNDFATPLEATRTWFENAQSPKKLAVIEAGEHFYRGLEERLVAEIIQWL